MRTLKILFDDFCDPRACRIALVVSAVLFVVSVILLAILALISWLTGIPTKALVLSTVAAMWVFVLVNSAREQAINEERE